MKPGDLMKGAVFGSYLYRALGDDEIDKKLVIVGGVKEDELVCVISLSRQHLNWALVLSQRGCLGWIPMDVLERA